MKRVAVGAFVPAPPQRGADALDRLLAQVLHRAKALASASLWLAFATPPAHGAPRPPLPPNTEAPDTEPAVASPWPEAAEGRDLRRALLQRAESALSQGRTSAASEAFERAALMRHASDTEMGQVRAAMQAGEYRRALAFAAHTAGHGESPAAAVQYAWLLRVGGQTSIADRLLAQTQAAFPTDEVVAEGVEAFRSAMPVTAGRLLDAPHRMAPESWALPSGATPSKGRVVASGVLIDGGAAALVPSASLPSPPTGRRLFVRNGMGQTVAARLDTERPAAAAGVTRLRLDPSLPYRAGDAPAPRDPFPGSPAFVVEYPVTDTAAPAWPWLRQGFLGPTSAAGARRLGIDAAAGLHGAAVLDAGGRVTGLAIPGEAGAAWLVPASAWRAPTVADTAVRVPIHRPLPLDEAYERALQVTLQVIVER